MFHLGHNKLKISDLRTKILGWCRSRFWGLPQMKSSLNQFLEWWSFKRKGFFLGPDWSKLELKCWLGGNPAPKKIFIILVLRCFWVFLRCVTKLGSCCRCRCRWRWRCCCCCFHNIVDVAPLVVAVAAVFPIDVNDVAAAAAAALFTVVDILVVVVYSDAVVLTLQTENSIDPVSKKNPRLFKHSNIPNLCNVL